MLNTLKFCPLMKERNQQLKWIFFYISKSVFQLQIWEECITKWKLPGRVIMHVKTPIQVNTAVCARGAITLGIHSFKISRLHGGNPPCTERGGTHPLLAWEKSHKNQNELVMAVIKYASMFYLQPVIKLPPRQFMEAFAPQCWSPEPLCQGQVNNLCWALWSYWQMDILSDRLLQTGKWVPAESWLDGPL